jgi:hypothetical protein
VIHNNLALRVANAIYSASAEERAIVGCFFDFQAIEISPRNTQKPPVFLFVKAQHHQSTST